MRDSDRTFGYIFKHPKLKDEEENESNKYTESTKYLAYQQVRVIKLKGEVFRFSKIILAYIWSTPGLRAQSGQTQQRQGIVGLYLKKTDPP